MNETRDETEIKGATARLRAAGHGGSPIQAISADVIISARQYGAAMKKKRSGQLERDQNRARRTKNESRLERRTELPLRLNRGVEPASSAGYFPAVESSGFFNPHAPVSIHDRNLAHWQQPGALVFLTWRLADALPAGKLAEWQLDHACWKLRNPLPWDASTAGEYRARFPARPEHWLDAGEGECVLRRPAIAAEVEAAMRRFDGERYELRAFVIMPNHVHIVVSLRDPWRLEKIVQGWKSWTGREINRRLARKGAVWQEGYGTGWSEMKRI